MYYARKQLRWKSLKIAVLLTGAILMVIIATLFAGNIEKIFAGKEAVIYAIFDNVKGLTTGAPIRFAGLQVGSVGTIEIRRDGKVKVALPLDRKKLKFVKTDAKAEILNLGLLGDKYVSIATGSKEAPSIQEGSVLQGEIPVGPKDIVTATQRSLVRLEQFMEKLEVIVDAVQTGKGTIGKLITDREMYSNIKNLTKAFSVILTNINLGKGTLGKILTEEALHEDISEAVAEIRRFTELLRNSNGSLHRFIADPRPYNSFLDATDSLGRLTQKLLTSNGTINYLIEDDRLYENLNSLTGQLGNVLTRIENGEGTLGRLAKEDQLLEEIRLTLKEFKLLLSDIRFDPQRYFSFEAF
jgi:phospholipid/cholesterol/gamma-HCH transport system substrate-binding protein